MTTIESVIGDYNMFLDNIFRDLAELGIDVSDFELDHMCYRVNTDAQFQDSKTKLSELGQLLGTTILGGRQICTFKLKEPILYKGRSIALIELPEHKENSKNTYPVALEHVEFAIGEHADIEAFAAKFPHVTYDRGEMHKKINPAIRIMLPKTPGSVKFHHLPLEEVIRRENEAKKN